MKTTLWTILATIAFLGATNVAGAATASPDDGSQLVVWAFLGMCALIVILQVLPLVVMSFGMVRALFKGKEAEPVEVVVDK
ncbi:MAG: hypothetical protein A2091_10575 [Desulfuromonadales bacterium GWD2_61_12]|nr:MAG: hypothetical protein A2091_10575 [Desulfuromonadales bacterium GWD2_61_12]HBT82333.1 hypothetical protein [Desulfuromonas sp.]